MPGVEQVPLMKRVFLLGLLGLVPLFGASPVVFYTDLDSGPATGGENNLGVFVTVVGKRFGVTQGTSTITLGGGAVTVKSWSDTKIVFQPGPGGTTGAISVAVAGVPSACVESGNCNFTVRPGNIYCISNSGNNTNNGKFTSETGGGGCWRGLDYSVRKLTPGDTLYFGANATDTFQSEPNDLVCGAISRADIWIAPGYLCGTSGVAGKPIALVGYPGNSTTIGGTDASQYAMEGVETAIGVNYWTFANMHFIGSQYFYNNGYVLATQGKGFRGVNLDLQLPLAPQSYEGLLNPTLTGATTTDGIVNRWYGLYLHNLGVGGTPGDTSNENSKHTAMIYQGADGNEQEFAWNIIDGTPQPGVGGVNRCYHNHSSPGTGPGNPIFGVHIHDNIFTGCAGNTFDATIDPGKGSGVEFYNNIIYHTGTCQNWVGYTYGYSYFLFEQGVGGGYDYAWLPQSGTMKFYNNTIYDINSCSATTNGLFSGPGPVIGNLTYPPPPVTICSSSCTGTHYSGTLPPTTWGDGVTTPYYFPLGVVFSTIVGSAPVPLENLVDDGNGHLTQEGQVVGTINYYTGAYDFTFLRTPPTGCTVQYYSIYSYRVDMKNNIIYLKSGESVFWDYSAGQQIFNMDHNLFYNEAGTGAGQQLTWPIKVTNPVGNNSNPMFASANTGDFHLQPGSPAIGSGVNTGIAWDFDGNPRTGNDLGAFAASSTGSPTASTSPCDLNGDGKVDQNDVTAATNQTIGVLPCGNLQSVGNGACTIAAIQRVEEAFRTGVCRVQ